MQPRLTELITTPAQWFPFTSLVAHRGGSLLVRVKAAESTYSDIPQGLRTLSSKEEHMVTSCLQFHLQIGLCEGTRGAGIR